MSNRHSLTAILTGCLLALPCIIPSSHASVVRVWEGNTDTTLLTPGNWVGGVAPSGNNAVQFGVTGSAGTTISVSASVSTFGYASSPPSINFTAGASAYTFSGAGSIGAGTGGITNASGQTQTFNTLFRLNTGNTHNLSNANSALIFGNTVELNADTTTFALGSATGQSLTFGNNLILGTVNPGNPKTIQLNGGANASTVTLSGTTNAGLTSNLRIGQNVRVNIGSSTGLSAATTINFNQAGAQLVNTSGSALSTNASLAVTTTGAITFGQSGDTAANSIAFNGTTAISADLNRTVTLNGTGLSVISASVWNNSATTSRQLTVNGTGNTLGLGGVAIGAAGEAANVTFSLAGRANVTLSGGVTNGLGTGTRGLQHNGAGVLTIEGASNYSGTTGVGTDATLLVNGTHTGGGNYSVAGILGGSGTIDLSANNATVGFVSGGTGRLQASSAETLTIIGGTSAALNLTNSIGALSDERLLFTLGNPGGTLVDVQGGLHIGTGLFDWNDFSFTAGNGFGAGTYNLFQYDALSGTLGTSLTGIIGGFTATISNDVLNKSIVLSVVPEPTSALAGLLLAGGMLRRRRPLP